MASHEYENEKKNKISTNVIIYCYLPSYLLQAHEGECMYKKVACPNNGCYVFLMRKVLSQHTKVCDQRTVKCKFCSTEIAYVQYNVSAIGRTNYVKSI